MAEHLNDGSIKLVEVDEDTDAYEKGHIPGAVSFHWRNELQDPVLRDFVDQAQFEKLLGAKGIGNGDLVVLYGGNNNWFAAYAYWYFKVYGHDNVKLMNGGRKKWELEGRELTAEKPAVTATTYTAKAADGSIRALRDEVIDGVGKTPMVDVRSPDEFSGKLAAPAHLPQEQAQRKGHIPGAKNVPWSKSANEDGTFKSIDELKALYQEEQGLAPEDETIAYCRIGERSSHTWFVLKELLGFPNVKNYDGSWTEYGSLVGRANRPRVQGGGRGLTRSGFLMSSSCVDAPDDYVGDTAIRGVVKRDGAPVEGAYVRLTGSQDEFVAEIRTKDDGAFRFWIVPGTWTVSVLSAGAKRLEEKASVDEGRAVDVAFDLKPEQAQA